MLIGDIVASRSLSDRAEVQRRLVAAVEAANAANAANAERAEALAAPLALTAGDEVQTLLADPAAAVGLVTRVSDALRPVGLAWGLGRGPLTTDASGDVSAMDGPCFHRAREAVEEAAGEGAWLAARGFSDVDDRVLSGLFRLLGVVRDGWTDTQFDYVRASRDRTQREVAEVFDRDETTVSRTLSRAHVRDLLAGEEAARALLATYRDGRGAARRARETMRTT